MSATPSLNLFNPIIRDWFSQEIGQPTDVQEQAWPVIAAGEHALVSAPTGSGKTLTAFLWAIDRFLAGEWSEGTCRVLYVSPLKALNNDIARNLVAPLTGLKKYAEQHGQELPNIRVVTRSGDTPERDRRRMAKHPPEILITTPESLNLLITSERGRLMLAGLTTVILDEIHAIAGDKRGTYLMSAVERLTLLSGEFQRIALSATVKPLDLVADIVGARRPTTTGSLVRRPVRVIESSAQKQVEMAVRCPLDIRERLVDGDRYPAIVESFQTHIDQNRSTLIFANSRKLTEKVSRRINLGADAPIAFSHHGSLSKEVRSLVEERFKAGDLSTIVATNSLELGIDIGDLDEVLLINAPRTLSSGVQRVGRAGHGVGATSRGAIYPTFEHAFVDAAVMAPLIVEKECEAVRPIVAPLDVMAQVIVAMTVVRPWQVDELYDFLRTIWAYHDLRRREYDLIIEMLSGRYADSNIRELSPRIHFDQVDGSITARRGSRLLIYRAGGVIPDRGYFNIRMDDSNALIGSLDEEFVWERKVGDEFTIGTQAWKIRKITHQDVVVSRAPKLGMPPFWRGETIDRDFALCERIGLFLEDASDRLDDPTYPDALKDEHFMDDQSVEELLIHLRRQVEATGPELPHRHHVLVEHYADPNNTIDSKRVVIHAQWGGRILRPLSICMSAAWERRHGVPLEVTATDESIALTLPHEFGFNDLVELVPPEQIESTLRMKLESTGFFGARFRENAARALLLPKRSFKKRMPLWLNRLRAKKLLQAVSRYDDFPILVETWRTCLQDTFDLGGLRERLNELQTGAIRVTEVKTDRPSPFASDVVWKGTDRFMYLDDTPEGAPQSRLKQSLIQELMHTESMRPQIPVALAEELTQKLHRTFPGYAPSDEREVLDLLIDRIVIPESEWKVLLAAVSRDLGEPLELDLLPRRAVRIGTKSATWVVAVQRFPALLAALGRASSDYAIRGLPGEPIPAETSDALDDAVKRYEPSERSEGDSLALTITGLMSFYGPKRPEYYATLLNVEPTIIDEIVATLSEEGVAISGALLEDSNELEVCDAENLERLLRMARAAKRPSFEPLPIESLPHFLADWQGLTKRGDRIEDLKERLEQLFGYCAPAALWETDILPARLSPYYQAWMDSALQGSELVWFGGGKQRVGFCFRDWLDLFAPPATQTDEPKESHDDESEREQPAASGSDPLGILSTGGRFPFEELQKRSMLSAKELADSLWQAVWSGGVSNDTFVSLRAGIQSKFAGNDSPPRRRRGRPGSWQSPQYAAGSWFQFPTIPPMDLLEEQEAQRDRVRQLFARHGVLFRERLAKELPALQWRAVFRTLRLMEFSGEAISGYFFKGIQGPQFADHAAYRSLTRALPEDVVYWLNATDPASCCGLGLEALKGRLPSRLPSTHLVYVGPKVAMVSKRSGRVLELNLEPEHSQMAAVLQVFRELVSRQFMALQRVVVETINGEPAAKCEYTETFRAAGFDREMSELVLEKRYSSSVSASAS